MRVGRVSARTARTARTAVATLLALNIGALLVFSVGTRTVTRTTSHPLPQAPALAAPVAPTTSTPAPSQPVDAPPIAPGPVLVAFPPSAARTHNRRPSTGPVATPPSAGRPTPTAPGRSRTPAPVSCPVKLSDATPPSGGLQSLISLAPAFGEFSAEAFAMASAYQPMLQLLGPILAQYPKMAPKIAPLVTPLVSVLQAATNTLFGLLAPIYTPYRQQVLRAETKLAAALAPYAEKLATSSFGGCIVDLEAALVRH
jgi:hypothetical protein